MALVSAWCLTATVAILQITLSLGATNGTYVEIQTYKSPDKFLAIVYKEGTSDASIRIQTWKLPFTLWQVVLPGLCGIDGTVSIRRSAITNEYINGYSDLVKFEDNDDFKEEVCFKLHQDLFQPGTVAFESVKHSGQYIRNNYGNMEIELSSNDGSIAFGQDASYRLLETSCSKVFMKKLMPTDPDLAFALNRDNNKAYIGTPPEPIFVQRPGLSGAPNSVSFQLCRDATKYLSVTDSDQIKATGFNDNSAPPLDTFNSITTFIEHQDQYFSGFSTYESAESPGYYISYGTPNGKMVITPLNDGSSTQEKVYASFKITGF